MFAINEFRKTSNSLLLVISQNFVCKVRLFSKIEYNFLTFAVLEETERYCSLLNNVQPFELKGVTRLIRSAVKNWRSGNFLKSFLMIQSHERNIKPFTAA